MTETPQEELDAAKRCSEAINSQLTFQGISAVGKWVAVALSNGKGDGNLYDTKSDAIRHQLHENLCAYVCITYDGMSVDSALSYMRTHRKMYAAGMRLCDPDKMVHAPMRREFLL